MVLLLLSDVTISFTPSAFTSPNLIREGIFPASKGDQILQTLRKAAEDAGDFLTGNHYPSGVKIRK